jgi:hypothetical protein
LRDEAFKVLKQFSRVIESHQKCRLYQASLMHSS